MVGVFFFVESVIRNNLVKFKGRLLKLYLLFHGCKVGKKLRCHSFPYFRVVPYKNISIGNNVTIGKNITLEILKEGKLEIADGVKLTQNIIVAVGKSVVIGNNTLVAENVSIRDGEHQIKKDILICKQPNRFSSVILGNDVWIGAGTIILKGSTVPDGCVIGASSLVRGGNELEAYWIYGGNPLRKIRTRE